MSTSSAPDMSPIASSAAAETPAEVELPAPQGWRKKVMPKKSRISGFKRGTIVFISPSGEEIKNKTQLDCYLKAHPGGHLSSEFDWGTGETPRRSARISQKAKASEMPEDEPPAKRARKSYPAKTKNVEVKQDSDVEMEDVSAIDKEEEKTTTKEHLLQDTKEKTENAQDKGEETTLAEDAKSEDVDKDLPPVGGEVEQKSSEEAQKDKAEEVKVPETNVVTDVEDKSGVEEDVGKSMEDIRKGEQIVEEAGEETKDKVVEEGAKENVGVDKQLEAPKDNASEKDKEPVSVSGVPLEASSEVEQKSGEISTANPDPHENPQDSKPKDVKPSPQSKTEQC